MFVLSFVSRFGVFLSDLGAQVGGAGVSVLWPGWLVGVTEQMTSESLGLLTGSRLACNTALRLAKLTNKP